jgi:HEAT repeat protein
VSPRTRRLLANLTLSGASTLVFLAALEGVARVVEHRRPRAETTSLQRLHPNQLTSAGRIDRPWPPGAYPFNADGVRDRVHAEEHPAGTWRLVFLGDSVTFGLGIEPREAFPQVVQARLDERGARAEVFNVSLTGWHTRQHRLAYARIVRRYRPDQVLLAICLNDIAEMQNVMHGPPPALALWLHGRSALVRLLIAAPQREIHSIQLLCTRPNDPINVEAKARFFTELDALWQEVSRDGARFGLVVIPFAFQLRSDAPPPLPQREILSFAERRGIPSLDLLDALRSAGRETEMFWDQSHLTPRGARRAAETILASGLIPDLPTPERLLRETWPRGAARAADGLLTRLRSEEASTRAAAAWAIGRREAPEQATVAALASALRDPSEIVRDEAAAALGRLLAEGGANGLRERAREALLAALHDPVTAVRWRAAEALWALGPLPATRTHAALAHLDHQDRYVASWAAASLARAGSSVLGIVLDHLAELRLSERDLHWTLRALRDMAAATPTVVLALRERLADPRPHVRARAAQALGRIGTPGRAAEDALRRCAGDPDPEVRGAAARALRRVRGEGAPQIP